MERIDKQYAVIYIDRTGESLKHADDNFMILPEMVSYYYTVEGALQWNFYLIVTKEAFKNQTEVKEEDFFNDDKYMRKLLVSETDLPQYLEKNFPDFKPTASEPRVILVKGDNWRDCLRKVRGEKARNKNFIVKMGKQRDESMLTSISNMDYLRAWLIKHPNRKLIFGTHISGEFSIAQKKFKIFL